MSRQYANGCGTFTSLLKNDPETAFIKQIQQQAENLLAGASTEGTQSTVLSTIC